jgi:nickel/cobalt exporter
MDSSAIVYFVAAGATAGLHALIPDHWLPFVAMGRTRNWSVSKTLALASASGALHVFLAIGLGLLAYSLGRPGAEAVAQRMGETLEVLSSGSLTVFGIVYGAGSWLRERRHHPSSEPGAGASHAAEKGHHHGHLLEKWFQGELSGASLVLVIGASPCALAFPILLASAASLGVGGVVLVAVGFGAATMLTTVIVTLAGSLSVRRLDFPFLTRYGDLISGVLISIVGAVLLVSEVLPGGGH